MSASIADGRHRRATHVSADDTTLRVILDDGCTISVPIANYPRLAHATAAERAEWSLIANGEGIHWPALDEDLEVAALIDGHPSGECRASVAQWLANRGTPGAA